MILTMTHCEICKAEELKIVCIKINRWGGNDWQIFACNQCADKIVEFINSLVSQHDT